MPAVLGRYFVRNRTFPWVGAKTLGKIKSPGKTLYELCTYATPAAM
jgi:hypothetical protein